MSSVPGVGNHDVDSPEVKPDGVHRLLELLKALHVGGEAGGTVIVTRSAAIPRQNYDI